MYRMKGRRAKVLGAVFVLPMGLISTGGAALAATPSTALRPLDSGAQSSRPFTAHVILSGSTLSHTYTPQGGAPATEARNSNLAGKNLQHRVYTRPQFQNGSRPSIPQEVSFAANLPSLALAERAFAGAVGVER